MQRLEDDLKKAVRDEEIYWKLKSRVQWLNEGEIDLAKAFVDKLQWKFIKNVLREIGIRGRFLEQGSQCFTTVNLRIILNGEISDSFFQNL